MLNAELMQEVKVLFGNGRAAGTGELLRELGLKKAFLVCDPGVVEAGIVARITDSLDRSGCEWVLYDKVVPDPPAGIIDEGAALCLAQGCDCVVAVGGGSAMDTGKGINLLRYNPGHILDYTDPAVPIAKAEKLIVLPTTAGTGSELSDGLVVSDSAHNKHPILAVNACASYAVLDPELTAGMPPQLTASTGMDALAHAVEAYTSTASTYLTDTICAGAIESILEWLPIAVKDGTNLEARGHMAAASAVSGWMLRYGHTHSGHSVAHILGAHFRLPHGFACACALPWVAAFNAPAIPEKTRRLGEWFGASFDKADTPEEIGARTRDAILRFERESLGLGSASQFPYDRAAFEAMSAEIAGELFQAFNPRPMSASDARAILEQMYSL